MSDLIPSPNAASAGVTPTRREVLSGLGLAVASFASTADADPVPPARAFRGAHTPKPLPFDPTKLTGISEKLIRSHWENNYSGAVKALNAVEDRLATAMADKDLPPYLYGDWKREELVRTGSVVLHENYFANLGGDGKPSGAALALVKEWFASYDAWEAEFRRVGMALSGGSGWVVLARNLHTAEVHNYWMWDHQHQPAFSVPLLVLDMYEHAYQMDYGAAAGKYIDAFFANVNWDEVSRRSEWSAKIAAR
ncbi:MAG TPA: Fe-Mn family superoxide dismutase [Vicinamibacteria bacterium]|nr:Fe-Mn family superoxide dismutase [Vicinamibacteria bacterium]